MKLHTRQLTCAAIVGAAYAVLSIFGSVFGITYGPIQCRFSEALCVLPFLMPETAWGLGVGCLIANLLSPYGILDIVVGSAATLLAALLTARCKKKWLAPLPPVAANMVLVGLVLAYEQAGTSAAFWPTYAFNALTVGAGEIVACYGLGMLILWRLEKSKALQNYLQNRSKREKTEKISGKPLDSFENSGIINRLAYCGHILALIENEGHLSKRRCKKYG